MATDTDLPQRDPMQALRIAGGSRQLAADLYLRFRSQLPAALTEIGDLLDGAEWQALREAVHRLSGATAACALPQLGGALDALGAAARAQDPQAARARLDELLDCAAALPDQIG